MKKIKERSFTETTRYVEKVICDKCGEDTNKDMYGRFDHFECSFRVTEGNVYPEGDLREVKQVDLCPDCATIILTHFSNIGCNINEFLKEDEV